MHRTVGALACALALSMALVAGPALADDGHGHGGRGAPGGACPLGNDEGRIQHVVYLQFDNAHFAMLALLGLRDDYRSDGRVLVSALRSDATPHALREHRGTVRALGDVYERLNASFGEFALTTLKASTTAIAATDEAQYERIEQAIAGLTAQRDALAPQIESDLEAAAFRGREIDERRARAEIAQAEAIVAAAHRLADGK